MAARRTFALAPRMQAVTLDVIMAGIFGVEGDCKPGTPEHGLRQMILKLSELTTRPIGQVAELMNIGRDDPVGIVKPLLARLDRAIYGVIAAARAKQDAEERTDILSLLLAARDEEGSAMTDEELRDELLTLVLAGHETTANSLAWTFERLLRNPAAYDRLRDEVRSGSDEDSAAYVEATIHEAMRNRPVVPITGRRVKAPWQLGEWRLPKNSHILARSHCCTTARTSTPTRSASGPSASSASSRAPTRGCRSAAASAAASARRSRWPSSASCCARSPAGPTWRRRIPAPSACCTATSRCCRRRARRSS